MWSPAISTCFVKRQTNDPTSSIQSVFPFWFPTGGQAHRSAPYDILQKTKTKSVAEKEHNSQTQGRPYVVAPWIDDEAELFFVAGLKKNRFFRPAHLQPARRRRAFVVQIDFYEFIFCFA
tara:strand:+ start:1409 stop:1768 length:360 start_codon:yes stop_codon:yes gene_type:complete